MNRERLSSVDTVLLRAEDPTNPLMVTGVMVFGAPVDYTVLRQSIEARLLQFDRFRQRVTQPLAGRGALYWAEDPTFDLDYHVQRLTLTPPGDQAALQDAVSLLASTQLDLSRPLWQLHLVETYGQGSALVCRLHHSMADGVALVRVLLSLADAGPDSLTPPEDLVHREGQRVAAGSPRLHRRRGWQLRKRYRAVRHLAHRGLELLNRPAPLEHLKQVGTEGFWTLADLLLMPPDPESVLRGDMGVTKRVAWSAPLPLQEVKVAGRRLGATVNDLLVAAMTGALRRYLQARGQSLVGGDLRAAVPVNMRPPEAEGELGNLFGIVFLSLPIGLADPVERLRTVKQRMDSIKSSLEPPVTFGLLKALGMVPLGVQDVLLDFLASKVTTLITNVIGPRERLYLAGAPIETIMFWVPQSGGVALGVSILSYAGQIRVGVLADEGLVPDPEVIVDGFQEEFEALAAVAGEMPPASVKALSTLLDEALATLDGMLEGESAQGQARSSPTTPQPGGRCQALTQAGRRCRNRALPDSIYCHIHR